MKEMFYKLQFKEWCAPKLSYIVILLGERVLSQYQRKIICTILTSSEVYQIQEL